MVIMDEYPPVHVDADDLDMPHPHWPEQLTPIDSSGGAWYSIPDWYFEVVSHGCSFDAARVGAMKALGQSHLSIMKGLNMSYRKVKHGIEDVCGSMGLSAPEAWPYVTWLLMNHGDSPVDAVVKVVALLQRGWRTCPVQSDLASQPSNLHDVGTLSNSAQRAHQ